MSPCRFVELGERGGVVVQHDPVDVRHDVERRADDVRIVAVRQRVGDRHRRLTERGDDLSTWAGIARSMARVRPQAMISESWSKLEDVVLRAARSLGLNHYTQASDPSDFVAVLGQLVQRGLSPEFFRVGMNLAVLQSQINLSNGQRSRPTPSAAEDFVTASELLMIAILRIPVETPQ